MDDNGQVSVMREPDNPESNEAVAYRLRLILDALEPAGTTHVALARSLGLSKQGWNEYLKGKNRVPIDVALRLCRRHGLTLDWLYRGAETSSVAADSLLRLRTRAREWAYKD
jgi:plasmid maintenance system antidote protein VapI